MTEWPWSTSEFHWC